MNLFEQAQKASKAKDWAQAEKRWQQVLSLQGPQASVRAYVGLTRALRKQGKLKAALRTAKQGLCFYPKKKSLIAECAEASTAAKDWVEAEKRWQQVLSLQGPQASVNAYVGLTRALHKQNMPVQAQKILDMGLIQYPDHIKLQVEYAQLEMILQRWSKAAGRWQKILEGQQSHVLQAKAYTQYALAMQNLHRTQEAEDILKRAEVALGPMESILYAQAQLYRQKAFHQTLSSFAQSKVCPRLSNLWRKAKFSIERYQSEFPESGNAHHVTRLLRQVRLTLINIYAARQAGSKVDQELHDYLNRMVDPGIYALKGIQPILRQAIQADLHPRGNSRENPMELSAVLQEQIQMISCSALSPTGWLNLYTLLWRMGFMRVSRIARAKALQLSCELSKHRNANHPTLTQGLLAAMDQGNLELAGHLIHRLKKRKLVCQSLQEILIYHGLLTGTAYKVQESLLSRQQLEDYDYYGFIHGKNVAIIGKAHDSISGEEQVASINVVVRLDPGQEEFLLSKGQTNVLSFARTPERFFDIDRAYHNLHHVHWIVLPPKSINMQRFLSKGFRVRVQRHKLKLFNGFLLHGMRSLYDIAKFRPQKIKLFNMNFYLAKNIYSSQSITQNQDQATLTLLTMLFQVDHDILSQLNFARNFLKAGLIDVDQECKQVLEMSEEDYAFRMENNFHRLKDSIPNPWKRI